MFTKATSIELSNLQIQMIYPPTEVLTPKYIDILMSNKIAAARMESFLFQTPEERYLTMMNNHPEILNTVQLYHISSYLGIQGPSLSRIRKR